MAKNSAKSKAREIYLLNPKIGLPELQIALNGEVNDETVRKYLIEFRREYGEKGKDIPEYISVKKLEKELAKQLEINPSSTTIKACIDFLKLKQMTDGQDDEIDIDQFIKKGEDL